MKNKSILSVLLCLFVMLGVFAGCSKEEKTEEPSTEEAVAADVTVDVTEEKESLKPAADTTAAVTTTKAVQTTVPAETTTQTPTTKAETTKAPETEKTEKSINIDAVAASIASHAELFEEPLSKGSSARALSMFGLSDADVSEAAYYTASAAVAEEVLVVKASSSDAVSGILNGIENRRASQIEDYADYVPKEVPKLQSAVVYTSGDYVVFCVSNNSSAASSVIASLF